MSSLGVLVAQNKNSMHFFQNIKEPVYAFERVVKEPKYLKAKFHSIKAYHVLDLEVNDEKTSGKIRVALINAPKDSKNLELWKIELTVKGLEVKMKKVKTSLKMLYDPKNKG